MKQDLIDLITAGYELTNQLVGDEVVNYNKLNTINFQVVRNLVGEFTTSKDENGTITTDTRLNNDYTETTITLNEIFNDYSTLTSSSGKGHSIIGGQGNHAEGFHNKLWGAYASNYNHTEGYDNKVYTGGMLLLGQDFSSDAEAQTAGYTNGEMNGYGNHIEGRQNNILFANLSHVEGRSNSVIKNDCGHAEGFDTLAYGTAAHAEGTGEGRPTWDYFPVVDDYATAVSTVSTAVGNILNNASTKNNPPKNTFSDTDIYTLMSSKVENLDSAIANQFMNYESRTSYIAFAPYTYSYLPNSAFGDASHTEGVANAAFEKGSHTEGQYNTAASYFAHTEGEDNHAFGKSSHIEGGHNITGAFAILDTEGKDITRNNADSAFNDTTFDCTYCLFSYFSPRSGAKLVFDKASFTENEISNTRKFIPRTGYQYTSSIDDNYLNLNNTERSLAGVPFYGVMPWGSNDVYANGYQHAEGFQNVAFGNVTHTEGLQNWAISDLAHIEGYNNLATYGANRFMGPPSDTRGTDAGTYPTNSKGIHIEGQSNTVYGTGTLHIEGTNNIVDDNNLYTVHTEGHHHIIRQSGKGVHIEGLGNYSYSNSNDGAHIEGHEFEYGVDYKWEYLSGSYGVREYTYATHNDYTSFNQPNLSSNVKYGPTVGKDFYRHYYATLEDGNTYDSYKYRISNVAYGKAAHAEGMGTGAIGIASHAEGMSYKFQRPYLSNSTSTIRTNEYYFSYAFSNGSHIEGLGNFINDNYPYPPIAPTSSDGKGSLGAHAEGIINKISSSPASHAEGYNTELSGAKAGHAEGISSYSSGTAAHAEGIATSATSLGAHAEGVALARTGGAYDSNGYYTVGDYYQPRFDVTTSLSFGQNDIGNIIIYNNTSTSITKTVSTVLNESLPTYNYNYLKDSPNRGGSGTTRADGTGAHAEGAGTQATHTASHSEGVCTKATGVGAHSEGILTYADSYGAHTEGIGTFAYSYGAHAEGIGLMEQGAMAPASHTEGKHCIAYGEASHSEGIECQTTQSGSHAEGYQSACHGAYGHTEGNNCMVTGQSGHAGGSSSNCYAQGSFVHGNNLQSTQSWQTIFGQYNILNSASTQLQFNDLIFVLGSGTSSSNRKNAMEVDKAGNLAIEGDVIFAGGQSLSDIIEELRQSGGGSSGGASYSSADLNTY